MDWAQGTLAAAAVNPQQAVQGSEAWKKWRGKGIGSSDAAVLLGVSPWKTIDQLYGEKKSTYHPVFGKFQRDAMARGTRLEPEIRKWYEEQVSANFPDNTAEHPLNSFIRASFDGLNLDFDNGDGTRGRVLEIKAPNAKDHELAAQGLLPEKYMPQVQWLMLVGDVKHADYVSFGADGAYHRVHVTADAAMQSELYARAVKFWTFVENNQEPTLEDFPKWHKPLSDAIDLSNAPDVTEQPAQISDQEIEAIVAEALQEQKVMNAAEARFEALKAQLKKALGTNEKMQKGEAVFGWQNRKGAVDYGAIPELIGLSLDQYRKADTRAFYFKRVDAQ